MGKKNDKLEKAAENLLKEITRLVRSFRKFAFSIPKKKMDKYIWLADMVAWIMLTISLVLRIGR